MALALLGPDDSDENGLTFVVDTGTNSYYRIHLGKEVRREEEFDLIDGSYWSSPLQRNPKAGRHVDTRIKTRLPAGVVTERNTLAQLETCRSPDGSAPAFSRPVPVVAIVPARPTRERVLTMSLSQPVAPASTTVRTQSLTRPRTAALCSAEDRYSRTASIADLIGAVAQAAAPIVLNALNPSASQGGSAVRSDSAAVLAIPAVLSEILRTVLGALARPPVPASKPPTTPPPSTAVSKPASTWTGPANRFDGHGYTRPMIFGIDDALLAAVAGPLVQALPQLLNAANKQKLDRQAQTDKHISDLLSEADRTLLMQQLISAQNQPVNPGITSSDLGAIASLLAQLASTPAPAGTPAVSRPASLDQNDPTSGPIASRAVLSAVTGPPVTLLGKPRVAFVHDQAMTLRYRLDVGAGGPATALPRAILSVCVREPGGAVDLCTHNARLTDMLPGSEIKVALSAEESGALPCDTALEVLASLRWKGAKGTYQSTCTHQVTVVSPVQVRDRGDVVGTPVELTDMNRFRPFWNRVWESPTQGAESDARPLWGLDAALRYSVVVVGRADGNGLMQTRIQQQPSEQGLRVQTRGRIKSGIEVSISELNKLLPLWAGEQPLSETDLAAFAARSWLAGQGGDALTQLRMEGRRGTRGLLWVVPVLRLRAFNLATAADVDPYGQLTKTHDRVVHFPVIESVRIIGLASQRELGETTEAADPDGAQGAAGDAPKYQFDGYDVVLQRLIGLEPAQPIPKARG